MLENFICCLKSCINCYRLFVAESGERRAESGERRMENGGGVWERYGRGI